MKYEIDAIKLMYDFLSCVYTFFILIVQIVYELYWYSTFYVHCKICI